MNPFRTFSGVVAPLDRVNVDTDQIIPQQFLKLIGRSGYGGFLFYDWRFNPDGKPKSDFVLNDPRYREAKILLSRANFGCGSSREHAVWALSDYGFKVLIASSYADIFYNNCFKNGLLPIAVEEETVDRLLKEATKTKALSLEVNLEKQTIQVLGGELIHFTIDPYRRKFLLEGLDDIALTLQHEQKIRTYEQHITPYRLVRSDA